MGPLSVCNVAVLWKMAHSIKIPFGMEVVLGPGHTVLDGDPDPAKGAQPPPQFSAQVCYGQTAGWIKMPLSTEVGLGPGDLVLDGGPRSCKKWAQPTPLFGPCLLWPNGWMDQDATWYEGRPWPRPHCVRWGPATPKKGQSPHTFQPCLLWPNCRQSRLLLSACCNLFLARPL